MTPILPRVPLLSAWIKAGHNQVWIPVGDKAEERVKEACPPSVSPDLPILRTWSLVMAERNAAEYLHRCLRSQEASKN